MNYSLIPEHMRDSVKLYLEEGIRPGSFLTAILENSLVESLARADHINQNRIIDWAKFLYHEMPIGSWGSKENVEAWVKKGGLNENQSLPIKSKGGLNHVK